MKTIPILFSAVLLCGAIHAQQFLTYEEFGAVGDGKTDDLAAIVATHAAANQRGLPVKATDGNTYYIGKGAKTAVIQTDVDFGRAKFIIDDRSVEDRKAPVFRISSSLKREKIQGIKSLKRGQRSLGVPLPSDSLVSVENNKVRQYIRYGLNQNNGTPMREVFLVNAKGEIDENTPINCDYETVTSITAIPIDPKPLTLKGGFFTTIANQEVSKYNYYNRGISICRSNVRIESVRHDVTGEGDHGAPYSSFLGASEAANVTITNCVLTAHKTYRTIGAAGKPVSMGSYDISANRSVNVSFINCSQTTDILNRKYWGLFGSNYCKNLLYDGCTFSRFDAHMGVANATIRNCRLGHMGINAIGYGTFLVENSTVCGGSFINLRADYGSTWNGDFIIRNCVFVPSCGDKATGQLIGGHYTGKHDFGYPCHMPRRIVVDGLKVDDSNHPDNYNGPYLFADFNPENRSAEYVEDYPYHVTEEVVLRNVITVSGKPFQTSRNPYIFRNVKISR